MGTISQSGKGLKIGKSLDRGRYKITTQSYVSISTEILNVFIFLPVLYANMIKIKFDQQTKKQK